MDEEHIGHQPALPPPSYPHTLGGSIIYPHAIGAANTNPHAPGEPGGGGGEAPAPALRSLSAGVAFAETVNLSCPKPAAVQVGDRMLMQVFQESSVAVPASEGWELVERVIDVRGSAFSMTIFTKVYAGEAGPYLVTWGGAKIGCAADLASWFSTVPVVINAHLGAAAAEIHNFIRGPSIVTTVPNCMIVMLGRCNVANVFEPPPGMATIKNAEGIMAQVLQPGAGATGNKDAPVNICDSIGYLVALAHS